MSELKVGSLVKVSDPENRRLTCDYWFKSMDGLLGKTATVSFLELDAAILIFEDDYQFWFPLWAISVQPENPPENLLEKINQFIASERELRSSASNLLSDDGLDIWEVVLDRLEGVVKNESA